MRSEKSAYSCALWRTIVPPRLLSSPSAVGCGRTPRQNRPALLTRGVAALGSCHRIRQLESSLQSSHRDRPLLAIGLVLASTVFLSCSDVTAKYLASSVPAIEIAWLRYLVFLLIVLPPVLRTGIKRTFRSQRPGLQVFRGLALVTSSILFISSLRYLPISEATATSFAAPIFITALSVVILGEKVGHRRWAAIFAGLIGVLVVVRPGTSAFDPASILPLMAALSWASAVVVTRQTSAVDSALTTLAYSAVIGVLVLSAFCRSFGSFRLFDNSLRDAHRLRGDAGHSLIIVAFRYGDASVLAPFTYTQLVWVTGLGILLFGAIPDRLTVAGATVIVSSGLYIAHRERIRSREKAHGGARTRSTA